MIVYRYLTETELNYIKEKRIDKLGQKYDNKSLSNTFHYKKDERYIHFFKDKESMDKIRNIHLNDGKDYYFCSFDIPYRILLLGIGKGYYDGKGYDEYYTSVREYIVKAKNFNPDWLKQAEFDQWKHQINEKPVNKPEGFGME